jgi:hypothetical protein
MGYLWAYTWKIGVYTYEEWLKITVVETKCLQDVDASHHTFAWARISANAVNIASVSNHLRWNPLSKTTDCAGDSISELVQRPWNSWLDVTEEGNEADGLWTDALALLLHSLSARRVVRTSARTKEVRPWLPSLSLELSPRLAEFVL